MDWMMIFSLGSADDGAPRATHGHAVAEAAAKGPDKLAFWTPQPGGVRRSRWAPRLDTAAKSSAQNLPARKSAIASWICSGVLITNGP